VLSWTCWACWPARRRVPPAQPSQHRCTGHPLATPLVCTCHPPSAHLCTTHASALAAHTHTHTHIHIHIHTCTFAAPGPSGGAVRRHCQAQVPLCCGQGESSRDMLRDWDCRDGIVRTGG